MWTDFAMRGGFDLLKNGASYFAAKADAESKQKWQDYNNKMTKLMNAANQNVLTVNENLAQERSMAQENAIRKSEYATKASAEVAAAAAGTVGGSVNAVLFDISLNAANASARNAKDLQAKMLQISNERDSSNISAQLQQDHTWIPEPSMATSLLGFGSDLISSYKTARNTQ
jgi:hypothetical protein